MYATCVTNLAALDRGNLFCLAKLISRAINAVVFTNSSGIGGEKKASRRSVVTDWKPSRNGVRGNQWWSPRSGPLGSHRHL